MPDDKITVDSAGEEPTVESDNQPSMEDIMSEINKLKEENEHWRTEADKFREQAKEAFAKRDKVKSDLRAAKESSSGKDELEEHVQKLEAKLQEKDNLLNQLEQNKIRNAKLNALQEVAKTQGLKELYLDKLERFVDLEEVDPEKKVSLRIAVDSIKSSYPDFFSATGETVDNALPNPKLNSSGTGTYKEQYAKMLTVPRHERTAEWAAKLVELKELISS